MEKSWYADQFRPTEGFLLRPANIASCIAVFFSRAGSTPDCFIKSSRTSSLVAIAAESKWTGKTTEFPISAICSASANICFAAWLRCKLLVSEGAIRSPTHRSTTHLRRSARRNVRASRPAARKIVLTRRTSRRNSSIISSRFGDSFDTMVVKSMSTDLQRPKNRWAGSMVDAFTFRASSSAKRHIRMRLSEC